MVVERAAKLLDQSDERRVRNERVRPQASMQFFLANDTGRFGEEQDEEVEGFPRHVHFPTVLQQQSPIGIDLERSEPDTHSCR